MGYDENRAAKPFTGTPYQLVRYLWRSYGVRGPMM